MAIAQRIKAKIARKRSLTKTLRTLPTYLNTLPTRCLELTKIKRPQLYIRSFVHKKVSKKFIPQRFRPSVRKKTMSRIRYVFIKQHIPKELWIKLDTKKYFFKIDKTRAPAKIKPRVYRRVRIKQPTKPVNKITYDARPITNTKISILPVQLNKQKRVDKKNIVLKTKISLTSWGLLAANTKRIFSRKNGKQKTLAVRPTNKHKNARTYKK